MPDSSLLLLLAGILFGGACHWLWFSRKYGSIESLSRDLLARAEIEAQSFQSREELKLKEKQLENQRELERVWHQERRKLREEEDRLKEREDKFESRFNLVEKKLIDIDKREALLQRKKETLTEELKKTAEQSENLVKELERVSSLSMEEAKQSILKRLENEVQQDAAKLTRRIMKEAEENAETEARRLLATAINRMASSAVSENTVATVTIPSDELKGRIIGREGRNIRSLERATGVNFIIDDTPGAVVLSCFDPVRRFIAKTALTELLADGRIHPTRIEEVVAHATLRVQKQIREQGEDATLRAGVMGLHPEIVFLLGKLGFRTSYGQNILEHSIEVAHLMGLMAGELGLDVKKAQRIGLLHDIGKALTHEVQGTHAVIGHDFVLKYGEPKDIANGIGCHHKEMEPITIEGSLCSSADALSASRPGARIEAIEEYIKRIKRLEELAYEFPGVEKAYALQAGREIRVIVLPDMIDDLGMVNLARDLTKRIESYLEYPGKIKITVVREKRAVEYAI